jgi:hypothetical protein
VGYVERVHEAGLRDGGTRAPSASASKVASGRCGLLAQHRRQNRPGSSILSAVARRADKAMLPSYDLQRENDSTSSWARIGRRLRPRIFADKTGGPQCGMECASSTKSRASVSVKGRIPNFEGADRAATLLLEHAHICQRAVRQGESGLATALRAQGLLDRGSRSSRPRLDYRAGSPLTPIRFRRNTTGMLRA